MVQIMIGLWRDVMLWVACRLDSWDIMLSTVVCAICFAEPDMILMLKNLLWCIRRRNPPWNVEYNLHAGLVVIEAWFKGY